MNLYIMTRGRVGKQYTLNRLPESLRKKTWLVTPIDECDKHDFSAIGVPSYVDNYSKKVQYILDGFPKHEGFNDEKAVILDDDLVFSRKEGKSLKTIYDPMLLTPLFEQMEALLDTYPLVGVHPRQMGQDANPPYVENGRIICIQGINRRLIGNVKVDQYPILADVVLNCTLLARGQKNALITTYFQDHGPCHAPGGCSIYRTPDMQRAAVDYLSSRFSGYVKGVERRPKVAKWMGDVRYDYTCQWKRLHTAGALHVLDPGATPHPDGEASGAHSTVVPG